MLQDAFSTFLLAPIGTSGPAGGEPLPSSCICAGDPISDTGRFGCFADTLPKELLVVALSR
jgi:hypothetical protein